MQFAAIVAGRPVHTGFDVVDVNKFALTIPSFDRVNHLVVFVIGDPFPEGIAATVHLNIDNQGWQMLGSLSNEKPSAIFKLSGVRGNSESNPMSIINSAEDMAMDEASFTPTSTAILGISIEPITLVQQQLDNFPSSRQTSLQVSNSSMASSDLSVKILQNLYNYVTSFASSNLPPQAHTIGGFGTPTLSNQSWIPVKTFEEWYHNILRKVKLDANYFHKAND